MLHRGDHRLLPIHEYPLSIGDRGDRHPEGAESLRIVLDELLSPGALEGVPLSSEVAEGGERGGHTRCHRLGEPPRLLPRPPLSGDILVDGGGDGSDGEGEPEGEGGCESLGGGITDAEGGGE